MQTNYAKSNAPAEPIKDPVKPKVVNPRWLTQGATGPNHKLSLLAFIAHSKLGKQIWSYTAKGYWLCRKIPVPAQAPKGATERVSINYHEDRGTGVTHLHTLYRWSLPLLLLQIKWRHDLLGGVVKVLVLEEVTKEMERNGWGNKQMAEPLVL